MYTEKSFAAKGPEIEKKWFVFDGTDVVVGKLAAEIAKMLRGKNKPTFTPNVDCGDFVVVTNVDKVKFTGKKWERKTYFTHSQHMGGLKRRTASEQLTKHPELIVYNAVKGMLPKTSLGRKQLTKLKLYTGDKHNHEAQKPEVCTVK